MSVADKKASAVLAFVYLTAVVVLMLDLWFWRPF